VTLARNGWRRLSAGKEPANGFCGDGGYDLGAQEKLEGLASFLADQLDRAPRRVIVSPFLYSCVLQNPRQAWAAGSE
jgi:hypothetical protein